MPDTKFREAARTLRSGIPSTKAIVLIGPDGVVLDHVAVDSRFDVASFASEYTTLLRIASRTSEDTGAGELREHISLSGRLIVFSRSVATGFYLVLITDIKAQVGRARYELKVAAKHLERALQKFGV